VLVKKQLVTNFERARAGIAPGPGKLLGCACTEPMHLWRDYLAISR
jgi:hypothetical protein